MRILDINNNELQEEALNFEDGYLEDDKIFKEHHEEIPAVDYQWHYKVLAIYFMDGEKYIPKSEDDPQIGKPNDPHSAQFTYIPKEGEEPRKIKGMSLEEVIDAEQIDAVPAWDEYEDIQRYKLYTEEEKAARAETQRLEEEKSELLLTGLGRLEQLEATALEHAQDLQNTALTRDMDLDGIFGRMDLKDQEIAETNSTVDDLVMTIADLIGIEE